MAAEAADRARLFRRLDETDCGRCASGQPLTGQRRLRPAIDLVPGCRLFQDTLEVRCGRATLVGCLKALEKKLQPERRFLDTTRKVLLSITRRRELFESFPTNQHK